MCGKETFKKKNGILTRKRKMKVILGKAVLL